MYREIEIVTMFLAAGVLTLMLVNRRMLSRLPSPWLFVLAPCLLVIACVASVVEGFWMEGVFNLLEHLLRAASAVLTAAWMWEIRRHCREAAR